MADSNGAVAWESNLIPGFGDEVVLFVLFMVLSVILIFFLSRRRAGNRGTASGAEANADNNEEDEVNVDNDSVEEEMDNTRDGVRHRQVTPTSEGQQCSEEERITLRLVSLHTSRTITVSKATTLQKLQQDYFLTELNQRRRIRFIYHGQVLADLNMSLDSYGIRDNSSLHVHVGSVEGTSRTPPQQAQPQDRGPDDGMLDLSPLFLPLIGLMLGIVWMSFLIWPYVFSLLTKVMLFFLSIGYVFLVYSIRS